MNKILMFILTIFLSSCSSDPEPEHVILSGKITKKFAEDLKKDKNYLYMGGGGGFQQKINLVTLTFRVNEKVTIDQARKMYVKYNEELVKRFNEDEEIRPYLKNYPFTHKNVKVNFIYFPDDYNSEIPIVRSIYKTSQNLTVFILINTKEIFEKISDPRFEYTTSIDDTIKSNLDLEYRDLVESYEESYFKSGYISN